MSDWAREVGLAFREAGFYDYAEPMLIREVTDGCAVVRWQYNWAAEPNIGGWPDLSDDATAGVFEGRVADAAGWSNMYTSRYGGLPNPVDTSAESERELRAWALLEMWKEHCCG